MRIFRNLVWIPVLLVTSVQSFSYLQSFSARGFSTRIQTGRSFRTPCPANIPHAALQASQDTATPSLVNAKQNPRQGKLQWIRNLFSRRIRLSAKARRVFMALFIAATIWLRGISGGFDNDAAHAAGPLSVKFTGAEVVARSPEWSSFGKMQAANQDMLSLVMQKRQAAMMSRQQQQPVTGMTSRTTMTATAAGIVAAVALPTGAGVVYTRSRGAAIAADAIPSDEEVELALSQQKELIDEVNTLSQAATEVEEPKEKGSILPSELVFLTLCALATAASYAMYRPE